MAEEKQNTDSDSTSESTEENPSVWRNIFRIDRAMVSFKLYYLFCNGAASCVIIFLPLQMKQVGLSPSMIGIASSARPIIAAAATAAICTISDRIGYRRFFVAVLLLLMLGSGVMLAFVPNPDELSCDEINSLSDINMKDHIRSLRSTNQICDRSETHLVFVRSVNESSKGDHNNNTILQKESLKTDRSWEYEQTGLFRTFIIILVLGSLFEIFWRPADALVDAATLVALKESGKGLPSYGSQRCWGNLSWDMGSFVAGILLNMTRYKMIKCGVVVMNANYQVIMIPFCVLMIGTVINTYWLRASYTNKKKSEWKNLKVLLTPHLILILSTILFFGICNGVVWGFLFWHLENLGATPALLGSVQLIQAAAAIPAGYLSSFSIKHIGHRNSLVIGFLIYAARFIWLYWIRNPLWFIGLEILQGFAFSQSWNVLISYISTSVPNNLFVTVCGICSALYFSFGVSIGYLLTGFMIKILGGSATFGYYGVACLVFAILFVVLSRIIKKPIITGELDTKDLLPPTTAFGEEQVLLPTCPVEVTDLKQQTP